MSDNRDLRIDRQRLMDSLETLGQLGRKADGSCCRLALTDEDKLGRDLVVSWMKHLGLEVKVDRVGNILGLLPGSETLPPVMTGSHIDTVATGGKLDGCYGVLAGLEALRTVKEAGIVTRHPLAVAVFTNEEGARFQPDMLGSLVYVGGLGVEETLAAPISGGSTIGEALARIGYAGSEEPGSIVPAAFIEAHIEQGPILTSGVGRIGAVKDLQGISWQEVTIQGAANHAGTTPMNLRRDAAWGAAQVICFVHDLALELGGSQVGTVGSVKLDPGLINVIPREAVLTVDLRNPLESRLQEAEQRLAGFLETLAVETGLETSLRPLSRTEPVVFDDHIIDVIRQSAELMGQPYLIMTSGAGQDAQMLARICPSAMIFVPSIGGISHSPLEATNPDDLELGANVLLQAMLKLAE
ncbi:MAG: Zn-dependent hydrolase [Spirochaetes bacterium RIFOXYC1_FULL_54_7]|nr:MAG: Zn-dependent hydrolase [Spirochaetes bacterium RIFOXYC1_FULL_54_7]